MPQTLDDIVLDTSKVWVGFHVAVPAEFGFGSGQEYGAVRCLDFKKGCIAYHCNSPGVGLSLSLVPEVSIIILRNVEKPNDIRKCFRHGSHSIALLGAKGAAVKWMLSFGKIPKEVFRDFLLLRNLVKRRSWIKEFRNVVDDLKKNREFVEFLSRQGPAGFRKRLYGGMKFGGIDVRWNYTYVRDFTVYPGE